jgi:suppressor of ftsI/bilirubin oxidase
MLGAFIIDDASAGSAALPHDYGSDDFPLVLQSTAITAAGAIATASADFTSPGTALHLLVNGVSANPDAPTLESAANRVRFRPLNASIQDSITIARADGGTFTQVASDSGLLPVPLTISSLRLSPGERAEIVLDLTAGSPVTLNATPRTPTSTNRYTRNFLQVSTTGTAPAPALPGTLNTIVPLDTTGALVRTITLSTVGRQHLINGVAGTNMAAMEANMIMVGLDDVEIWDVVNSTPNTVHHFHLHDVPFQVLSVGGQTPTGPNVGWRDTIEVPPRTTVRIAMKFTDFTDPEYMYMLHCHNLVHEDAGMMAALMVM